MHLNTEHFARCIKTLESSLTLLTASDPDSIEYEIYRNAVVKGFELTLETGGKLLRKALKAYTGSPREVDSLTYKDVLRHAAKHGLMEADTVERWFLYRDNRNSTAHDYGVGFAEDTLKVLPGFIVDARALEATLLERSGDAEA
ncbi:nucleotidyltransferase substrate binding protein [Geomonas subterranea]|uniref:Nucleotidyltransferase substrate binding protein n=1 Tax=Geomonas subterranea TaxID=2847989 RepID=A0ABX8LC41_9BACT|nr:MULTISPECIES: nucleotidyltransferase substrate binding protein [Geomonas]QXE89586.1 nucleotidyltransferase substrate binding protein [Geomonas subterranea]QXM08297.1 nucleotidyltransferase substrate binding protein [Geomonas subterranea]